MDVTKNKIQDEADLSENQFVHTVYGDIGHDIQGPAGTKVPDNEKFQQQETSYFEDTHEDIEDDKEMYAMDAAPGSFTVEELANNEALAASMAASKVHASNTMAMLDMMECIEEEYNSMAYNNSVLPREATTAAEENVQVSKEHGDISRARVVDALAESLSENPFFYDCRQTAEEIEREISKMTRSKAVYGSVVSNAVRVARQQPVESIEELIRIATGTPRKSSVVEQDTMFDTSGLQDYTLKE